MELITNTARFEKPIELIPTSEANWYRGRSRSVRPANQTATTAVENNNGMR